LGLWKVVEYEHFTARTIRVWCFQGFNEADQFRRDRVGLYASVGLCEERGFTEPSPEISESEMDMFTKIIENPEFLDHVMRTFHAR